MSSIFVSGWGAVSPAGWGAGSLRSALKQAEPIPTKEMASPGQQPPLRVRGVPHPPARPAFVAHPRLRRTSPIAHYAVASALEALGSEAQNVTRNSQRLGIIYCAMSGCVNYSRRFYDETLKDPALASPVIFPETVFNAPASHLAALLGATAINYTLIGDPGTFLQALALAADWLVNNRVDGCLVVGAEEIDWLVTQAAWLFAPAGVVGEGAGALYLRREPNRDHPIQLSAVTDPVLFSCSQTRAQAAQRVRAQLNSPWEEALLCDSAQGVPRLDRAEQAAWRDWTGARISPKNVCGEAFIAAAAWQCVAALEALAEGLHSRAIVSVVGCNEQAIAAEFVRG